ncbi:MAG: hypothetical protein RIQ52_2073 [Pseudomonadota bacterium]|jgi:hypothetical protein
MFGKLNTVVEGILWGFSMAMGWILAYSIMGIAIV